MRSSSASPAARTFATAEDLRNALIWGVGGFAADALFIEALVKGFFASEVGSLQDGPRLVTPRRISTSARSSTAKRRSSSRR